MEKTGDENLEPELIFEYTTQTDETSKKPTEPDSGCYGNDGESEDEYERCGDIRLKEALRKAALKKAAEKENVAPSAEIGDKNTETSPATTVTEKVPAGVRPKPPSPIAIGRGRIFGRNSQVLNLEAAIANAPPIPRSSYSEPLQQKPTTNVRSTLFVPVPRRRRTTNQESTPKKLSAAEKDEKERSEWQQKLAEYLNTPEAIQIHSKVRNLLQIYRLPRNHKVS